MRAPGFIVAAAEYGHVVVGIGRTVELDAEDGVERRDLGRVRLQAQVPATLWNETQLTQFQRSRYRREGSEGNGVRVDRATMTTKRWLINQAPTPGGS